MLGLRWWIAGILLWGMGCAQPRLIEGDTLDQGRLHNVVDRASSASGLRVITPLSVELVTRDQLHHLLKQVADEEIPSDNRMSAESTMGLSSFHNTVSVDLYSRVTTGLYLPLMKALYLVREPVRGINGSIHISSFGELGDEVTLAHEVIHALQHQHFPHLFDLTSFPEGHSDASAALQAALEGSATFAAAKTLGFLGRPRDPDKVISDSRSVGPLADEDPLVRERMVFPYTYGYRIAYHAGKDLLESPPASTEQVIHDRDRSFLAIDLSKLRMVAKERGCRTLYQDTMGELGASLWLRKIRQDADRQATEGWDGDRWIAFECNGKSEFAWLTSWDTQRDAIEFNEEIAAIADDLLHVAKFHSPVVSIRDGREVVVVSSRFPIKSSEVLGLANKARVTTREELSAHFRNVE